MNDPTPAQNAARLLASRPDLYRRKGQRRLAARLGTSIGARPDAIGVLAGWLSVNTDQEVADLTSLLEDRVTMHLAGLPPEERRKTDPTSLRADVALDLGWASLRGHGPREVLKVLALAGSAGGPRTTVERVARAGAGAVDDVLRAGFALAERGTVRLGPGLDSFLEGHRDTPEEEEERLRRWLTSVRADLESGAPDAEIAAAPAMDAALERGQRDLAAALGLALGCRLTAAGDLLGALDALGRGLTILDPQDSAERGLAAALHLQTALVHLDLADAVAAAESLVQAASAAEEPAPVDAEAIERLMVGIALARARLCLQTGRPADALSAIPSEQSGNTEIVRTQLRVQALDALGRLEEAAAAAAELPGSGSDLSDGGAAALSLTRGRFSTGDERRELFESARVFAGGNLDRPSTRSLPLALLGLGIITADDGDLEAAATLLNEASMLAASVLPRNHPHAADIRYVRGLLHLAAGDTSRGERDLERAAAAWAEIDAEHPHARLARAARACLDLDARGKRGKTARSKLGTEIEALAEVFGEDSDVVDRLQVLQRRTPGHAPTHSRTGGSPTSSRTTKPRPEGRGFGSGRRAQD